MYSFKWPKVPVKMLNKEVEQERDFFLGSSPPEFCSLIEQLLKKLLHDRSRLRNQLLDLFSSVPDDGSNMS